MATVEGAANLGGPEPLRPSNYCVFLLGAGFSADYGLPVMRQFISVATRRFHDFKQGGGERLEEAYDRLLRFFSECRQSTWALDRQWGNIEELFTQADLRRLAGWPLKPNPAELCTDIEWVIWDTYRRRQGDCDLAAACEAVKKAGLTPVFITTNYDTACESTLWPRNFNQPHYSYVGFEHPNYSGQSHLCAHESSRELVDVRWPAVPVIKLHGSVNWFRIHRDTDTWFAAHNIGAEAKHSQVVIENPAFPFDHFLKCLPNPPGGPVSECEVHPGIVAPALSKATNHSVIGAQLRAAIQAIEGARAVWIIGYSFPPTDVFMTRLLTEGLKSNADFSGLHVCDIVPESTASWQHFRNVTLGPIMRDSHYEYFQTSANVCRQVFASNAFSDWRKQLRHPGWQKNFEVEMSRK